MEYEVRLTNVPDGAYTEDYLGSSRLCATRKNAEILVKAFYAAKKANPKNFEPDMEAEIIEHE